MSERVPRSKSQLLPAMPVFIGKGDCSFTPTYGQAPMRASTASTARGGASTIQMGGSSIGRQARQKSWPKDVSTMLRWTDFVRPGALRPLNTSGWASRTW
jgi:hypothetical protein